MQACYIGKLVTGVCGTDYFSTGYQAWVPDSFVKMILSLFLFPQAGPGVCWPLSVPVFSSFSFHSEVRTCSIRDSVPALVCEG